ncbi:Alkaline phosphatase synthesis transcriptional regulatory protein SphR [Acaryochloris thomasi RCC1774]|uniref:Alkaline phosphatase synthesis transcriptional regulatory protein SphR n=1 Tax=Acaryochloris thomasi RCC1774 TaxID=1764569 RepID=A0A2W1JL54_9CYAN|nr:response regulator [Acaryochloris thomasi]PZD70924.1 Alkaline phosphatase synthesis transcriptional regulatory protein SphR [Acaryochloris thomasi RCC1774]
MRILIVEDDALTAEALKTLFTDQNYAVELTADGHTAADLVEAFEYDLILSDVMLPGLDGVSLCRQLRSQGHRTPILLLTGKDNGHDKAVGLDAGADDYVVKPFDPEELAARVRALLRRGEQTILPILEWEAVRLDPKACEVRYNDSLLQLTPKEYGLLELLMRNNRRVFSCGMVLEHLWAYEDIPGEDAVRTHIKGLRQKLKAAGAPTDLIETVYGIGYRLKPLADLAKSQTVPVAETPVHQQTLNAIADIWVKFQPRVSKQVGVLEEAATALDHGSLNPQLHQKARQEAHTLAGGLGTFGLPEGSRVARNIERLLKADTALTKTQVLQLQQDVAALRQEVDCADHHPQVAPMKSDEQSVVLIVDCDLISLKSLTNEAQQRQIRCQTATSITLARDQIQRQHPSLVLYEPAAAESEAQSSAFLLTLSQQSPPVPVLIFTSEESFSDRITAARLGGQAYLSKSLPTEQVWDRVEHTLQSAGLIEAQVMIVDDDPKILEAVAALLKPWGLAVTTLKDPSQFWETLTACSPDLLVLDVEMPQISGVDLCKVVRNDPQWEQLPIIFLTAHTEPETVNQVYVVGADDFVSKPIVGPELVVRILNRLERSRLQQQISETDPVTQVLNRKESIQTLENLLNEVKHQPLCLIMLEVERIQQINDCFGFETGDQILKHVTQCILQSKAAGDVVVRKSGTHFVVGLRGLTKTEGRQWFHALMTLIDHRTFNAPDHTPLQITCSAGIAQYPDHAQYPDQGTELQRLFCIAETAKARGWGQVHSVQPLTTTKGG